MITGIFQKNPSPLARYVLAAISAALYFLAFVGFGQWYLAWFSIVPLLFALEGTTPRQGLFIGWFFGTVALVGGFYWLAYTIHVFAFMPWPVAMFGCVLLCAAQATEFAVFGFIYSLVRRRTKIGAWIAAPVVFTAAEFVCPQLFPHYFGASQYEILPLIQISDITGVLGVTAIVIFVNGCIYEAARAAMDMKTFTWKRLAAAALAVSCALVYGYFRIPMIDSQSASAPKMKIGIAQANLGIREKSQFPQRAIDTNLEMSRRLEKEGAALIVWPETAVQRPVLTEGIGTLPEIVFSDLHTPLLTGALEFRMDDDTLRTHNIAVLAGDDGSILGTYSKQKLLMLGEYIPFGEAFPQLYELMPFISRFTPGNSDEPLILRNYRLNVNICYEEIIPRFIRRMMEKSANVIINITNDNWFGDTHEPMQHLVLALFRAVEHRRWLVRSTNTGISAFIDASGRIVSRTPLMEPATLIADVPMMRCDSFYTRFGDWFGWGATIATLLLIAICAAKRPHDNLNRSS